jgi:hypothetical protein
LYFQQSAPLAGDTSRCKWSAPLAKKFTIYLGYTSEVYAPELNMREREGEEERKRDRK